MPYRPNRIRLEYSTDGSVLFRVLEDLTYFGPGRVRRTAKAGLMTDLATIPRPLWSIVVPVGAVSLPAIIHDQECKDIRSQPVPRSRKARNRRKAADGRFLEGLLEQGVPRFRAAMMWAGVSLGRYWDHGGRAQRLVMLTQLALGYAAIVASLFQADTWTGWAFFLAPAVAAVAWWRDSRPMLLAQYPGLPIVAIACVNFTVSWLEWIPNVIFGVHTYPPSPEQLEAEEDGHAGTGRARASRSQRQGFRGVQMPPLPVFPGWRRVI